MKPSERTLRCRRSFLLQVALIFVTLAVATGQQLNKNKGPDENGSSNTNNSKTKKQQQSNTKVISLAESITRSTKLYQDPERIKASRKEWKKALEEIKQLTLPRGDDKRVKEISFMQWKMLLDEPTKLQLNVDTNLTTIIDQIVSPLSNNSDTNKVTPRFEGFASWERILQDWADDVQEYMDKIDAENTGGYPLSSWGSPGKATSKSTKLQEAPDTPETMPHLLGNTTRGTTPTKTQQKKREPINLPVPAPAKDGEEVLPHTDLSDKSKNIWIVTTASLPWMTGTAVNPLLRAAYMTKGRKEAGGSVTLMIPWLERRQDQERVYGPDKVFENPEEQEEFVRTWLRESAKMPQASEELKIKWYTAWQNKVENSVYSMGDLVAEIPEDQVDICILEEPEHLNWYRAPGDSWTDKFKHVVGIIHTNYFVYAQEQPAAFIRAPAMRLLCSWMCRAHCHRIVKLSGTLGQFAPEKELIENVHGIRGTFLEAGKEVKQRIRASPSQDPVFGADAEPSVYFIGKMLWSKGLGSLMELLKYAEESAGIKVKVDMYGGGPDKDAAEARAKDLEVDMNFHGPIDHAELAFTHKIFINPSTSEVLCTTVAEALGMGKFVVVPSHPSNDFFAQFPNCLTYTNKEEFVGNLYYALTHSPEPMDEEYLRALSWEAATERLEAAGSIPLKEAELMKEALSSEDAGIEITLPPLIEDTEGREIVASGLRKSRARYRQFRSRLSQEVLQSKVLPARAKERLVNELDKRLDLDIDRMIESPKLRLQLSPAELDQRLLELYKSITEGPTGDILRIIGGGQEVALQDFYIKSRAARKAAKDPQTLERLRFGPFQPRGDDADEAKRTASQWVNLVLRRNLPKNEVSILHDAQKEKKKDESKLSMSLTARSLSGYRLGGFSSEKRLATTSFVQRSSPSRSSVVSFSLLI